MWLFLTLTRRRSLHNGVESSFRVWHPYERNRRPDAWHLAHSSATWVQRGLCGAVLRPKRKCNLQRVAVSSATESFRAATAQLSARLVLAEADPAAWYMALTTSADSQSCSRSRVICFPNRHAVSRSLCRSPRWFNMA